MYWLSTRKNVIITCNVEKWFGSYGLKEIFILNEEKCI